MKRLGAPLLCLLTGVASADPDRDRPAQPAALMAGLGRHHHPVSTANAEAQKFFDQGLTLLYAFNHDEAARSFARAAELDPKLAMAHWGVALVKGPNYNLDADDGQWQAAHAALQKALGLAARAPEPEREYVRALAQRYSPDPKADRQLACLARGQAEQAGRERREFLARKRSLPKDAKVSDWNTAEGVLGIAEAVLEAKAALARGDRPQALELLRRAVRREDALNYGEPPDWLLPVRETLGAVLLLGGDAAEAEAVFRAGLAQYPRSGRCLLGLRESLKAQKKDHAARLLAQEFRAAWQNADGPEPDLKGY